MARRAWPWLLVAVGIAWWAGVWISLDRSVLTRVPILDEAYYLREGAAIQSGRLLPPDPFVMSPLYPYLVAATGSGRTLSAAGVREGGPAWGIRILQAALWMGVAALLWRMARRRLPPWAAAIPPLAWILYRPAAVFAGMIVVEVPLTFAVLLALHLVTGTERPGRGRAAAAGAALGAAMLLRGSAGLLLLPAAIALWRPPAPAAAGGPGTGGPGRAGRRRLASVSALVGVALLVVAPPAVFNTLRAGRPAGFSCNGGLNLYIGHGPEARGYYVQYTDLDFETDPAGVGLLSARLGRTVPDAAAADRVWTAAAWRAIREDPARAVRLWLKKVWLHFAGWEIDQITPLGAWARASGWLRLLVLPYGALAAAGLAGLALCGWRERSCRIWLFALLCLVGGQSLFFVVSRYRLVLVPLLALGAGAGAAAIARSGIRGRLVGAAVVLLAVLAVLPWGQGEVRTRWRALALANEAVRWERLGTDEARGRAELLYRRAVELDPVEALPYRGLARVLAASGDRPEAERILAGGALRVTDPTDLERDLIALLLARDAVAEAVPRLAAFLREHPDDPEMLHNHVVALSRTGRHEAALAPARHLVEVAPDSPRGYQDLGILLARLGRVEEARQTFRDGLRLFPADEDLQRNLALLEHAGQTSPSD